MPWDKAKQNNAAAMAAVLRDFKGVHLLFPQVLEREKKLAATGLVPVEARFCTSNSPQMSPLLTRFVARKQRLGAVFGRRIGYLGACSGTFVLVQNRFTTGTSPVAADFFSRSCQPDPSSRRHRLDSFCHQILTIWVNSEQKLAAYNLSKRAGSIRKDTTLKHLFS